MRTNILLSSRWLFFSFMFLFTGCMTEHIDIIEDGFERKYKVVSGETSTKTHFNDQLKLLWDEGDVISIFDGIALNQKFGFDGKTDDNSGTFSKLENKYGTGVDLSANYAVYPYYSDTKITERVTENLNSKEGVIEMNFPSVQKYGENSFGLESSVMVAATSNTQDVIIRFKNACGWIKFLLYSTEDVSVKTIVLQGNNGEKISGPSEISMSYNSNPEVTINQQNGLETITLDCGEEGVTISNDSQAPTEFWFSVPPIVFETGFKITISDVNGCTMEKGTEKSYTVERNIVKALEAFEVEVSTEAMLAAEKAALIDLYEETSGESWSTKTNWCTEEPINQWYGVITDEQGFVTKIELPDNGLTGQIPASICNLKSLEHLDLHNNKLEGSVPENLGNLRNMKTLKLQSNSLTGEVPESIWTGMDCLVEINIADNKFSSLNMVSAEKLSIMKNTLKYITLSGNYFNEAFPDAITGFTELMHLKINGCGFKGEIPSSICGMTSLTELECGGNNFTGTIPSEIGCLTGLIYLSFGSNALTGEIPAGFESLTNLQTLCLDHNTGLSGSIDVILKNCTNLVELQLTNCGFSGFISGIGNLTSIEKLFLAKNNFEGAIPDQICNLTNLTRLELHDNNLTGSIPGNIGNLTALTILNLGGNKLSGSIPASITNLSNITYLALGNMNNMETGLEGAIPQDLNNLKKLTHLYLDGNNLSGTLPDIKDMTALSVINLSNNINLGGEITRSTYNRLEICDFRQTKIMLVEDDYSSDLLENGESGEPSGF